MIIDEIQRKNKSYSYIQNFSLTRKIDDEGATPYVLDLALCEFPNYGDTLLHLQFSGVLDIKIDTLDGLYNVILSIDDISANQMEGINYRVVDVSGNNLSFLCREIEIIHK